MSSPATAPLHALYELLLSMEHKQLGLDDFWWRLVHLREYFAQHGHDDSELENNLLTRLHSVDGPLQKQRESTRRAVLHWFLRGDPTYEPVFDVGDRSHFSERALEMLNRAGTKMVMDELERRWDEPISKASFVDDGSGFWTESVLEAFEGGTTGKHKALPDKQRGH
jgi:hypothetical protein